MKKIILGLFLVLPTIAFAQSVREDFDSNTLGWNEFVGEKYSAIIKDGALHLETLEKAPLAIASCYLTVDPQKPFEIKAKLMDTKINDEERGIGIVFNYLDDCNFDVFLLSKDKAYYWRYVDNKCVGTRCGDVKFQRKQKDHDLSVKYGYDRLEFFVNNVKALEIRNAPMKYNGFGLMAWALDGKQTAQVDYIEFIQ